MPKPNNGHIGGVTELGKTTIEISTNKGVIKIIPDGPAVQEGKKLKYTGVKPGTEEKINVVGHEIKNNRKK